MSSTSAPFGLRPAKYWAGGGGSQALQYNSAGISSGYTSSIYENSAIKYSTAGTLNIATSAEDFLGAFVGVKYTPDGDRPRITNYWPASQALATSTTAAAYFYDDPTLLYEIQANGTLAQTAIGDQGDLVNAGSGNSITGLSQAMINSTLAGSGTQAQLSIKGLALNVDNDWGDAFTVVQVTLARSQYISNKVGF